MSTSHNQPQIAEVVVGLPVDGPFDYHIKPQDIERISPGSRVRMLFNRRLSTGYVVNFKDKSHFPHLNTIIDVLDPQPPLTKSLLELTKQLSEYYGCSQGEAIEAALPDLLRKSKSSPIDWPIADMKEKADSAQTTLLIDQIRLEEGQILFDQIKKNLAENKGVIFLLPETKQVEFWAKELKTKCNCPVLVWDKHLTPKQELEAWIQMKKKEVSLVIGTRSAVFAPMPHLGLIIMADEENDSYKQDQTPHYHAREVVLMRQGIEGHDVIFVSSLPSVELKQKAKKKKWNVIETKAHAVTKQIIDMTNYNPEKTSPLSFPLQNHMQKVLEARGKVLIFMNRRGFTIMTRCNQCGFTVKCPRCDANLIYLYADRKLACRHCNHKEELPKVCPQCKGTYLRSMGTGIEKLESEVARYSPQARIAHYDKDSERFPQEADVVISTQAVLGCRYQLKFDLTAIINFDSELNRFDFSSGHKAYNLLLHLEEMTKERLLIQTRLADHYVVKSALKSNREKFYKEEMALRKQLQLPPTVEMVALEVRGPKEESVLEQSQKLYESLSQKKNKNIISIDLHQGMHPKLRDNYYYTVLLKTKNHIPVLKIVKAALKDFRRKGVIITINVDP